MNEVTTAVQDLARRLVVQETSQQKDHEAGSLPALCAVEKLRGPLSRLVGTAAFQSLLTRALSLASAYTPWLVPLRIEPDSSVVWSGSVPSGETSEKSSEGGAALLAELIGLLIAFVGQGFTLLVLRNVWPNANLDQMRTEHGITLL
jgi:hypothetical protein